MTAPGIALRLGGFIVLIIAATWISHEIRSALDIMVMPRNEAAVHRSILIGTVAYTLLLSLPFVPGAEIGITMLTVFGAPIAPLVYGATVTALMLSYTVGRLIPSEALVTGLRRVRLRKTADRVAAFAPLSGEERLAILLEGGSPRLVRLACRYRYLALILAVNTPGNVVIGGGGGIALMAGMSRLYGALPFLLAIAVAVAPVPLAVMLFGG